MTTPSPSRRQALFRWYRPASRWEAVCIHGPFVLLTGIMLAASFFIAYPEPRFRTCTMLWICGWPCPFCGSSRTFAAMTGGDWAWAWVNSPMAVGLYLFTVVVFLWNLTALALGRVIRPGSAFAFLWRRPWRTAAVFAVVVLLNWVYRLTRGFDIDSVSSWL